MANSAPCHTFCGLDLVVGQVLLSLLLHAQVEWFSCFKALRSYVCPKASYTLCSQIRFNPFLTFPGGRFDTANKELTGPEHVHSILTCYY